MLDNDALFKKAIGNADYWQASTGLEIDYASVRYDILMNCIRTTTNPQVRNSALLLVSALAKLTPELILHSIMPIFTFMGANVLRQDDDFSAYVVKQASMSKQKSIDLEADKVADHGISHPTSGAVTTRTKRRSTCGCL